MKNGLKRVFCFCAAIVCGIIFFTLKIIVFALKASPTEREYEPTSHEIRCGQKLLFSDKYFIPDEKPHK